MKRTVRPMERAFFLVAVAAALLAPMLARSMAPAPTQQSGFPGWPHVYEGATLTELPLTEREAVFARDFPGRIGRFSDGRREIVLRWVAEPTRRLHPASECFRGLGYRIDPLPLRRSTTGQPMGCFRASGLGDPPRIVCEHIESGTGESWADVSAWYWETLIGQKTGPWWSVVLTK